MNGIEILNIIAGIGVGAKARRFSHAYGYFAFFKYHKHAISER